MYFFSFPSEYSLHSQRTALPTLKSQLFALFVFTPLYLFQSWSLIFHLFALSIPSSHLFSVSQEQRVEKGGTSEVNLGISAGSWTLTVKEAGFERRESCPLGVQKVFTERTQKLQKSIFFMYSLKIFQIIMFAGYLPFT